MNSKKKYTVITAIFGDYECLHDNQFTRDDFEYICVTDNPNLKSRLWKIIYMPKSIDPSWSPRKKTYYVRYHLFEFCDTQHAIWIDGSVALGDITIPLLRYETFNCDRMFLSGFDLQKWCDFAIHDALTNYRYDVTHSIYNLQNVLKILNLCNEKLYSKVKVSSHHDYEKLKNIKHINGRLRVIKNTNENIKTMHETFDTLISDELLQNDSKHYFYDDCSQFEKDIFFYDEPVYGIISMNDNEKDFSLERANLPFTWYSHDSNEIRFEDY